MTNKLGTANLASPVDTCLCVCGLIPHHTVSQSQYLHRPLPKHAAGTAAHTLANLLCGRSCTAHTTRWRGAPCASASPTSLAVCPRS